VTTQDILLHATLTPSTDIQVDGGLVPSFGNAIGVAVASGTADVVGATVATGIAVATGLADVAELQANGVGVASASASASESLATTAIGVAASSATTNASLATTAVGVAMAGAFADVDELQANATGIATASASPDLASASSAVGIAVASASGEAIAQASGTAIGVAIAVAMASLDELQANGVGVANAGALSNVAILSAPSVGIAVATATVGSGSVSASGDAVGVATASATVGAPVVVVAGGGSAGKHATLMTPAQRRDWQFVRILGLTEPVARVPFTPREVDPFLAAGHAGGSSRATATAHALVPSRAIARGASVTRTSPRLAIVAGANASGDAAFEGRSYAIASGEAISVADFAAWSPDIRDDDILLLAFALLHDDGAF
jgi:hypothetical protein